MLKGCLAAPGPSLSTPLGGGNPMLLGPRVGGITNGARGAMMGSGQETRTGSPYANSA